MVGNALTFVERRIKMDCDSVFEGEEISRGQNDPLINLSSKSTTKAGFSKDWISKGQNVLLPSPSARSTPKVRIFQASGWCLDFKGSQ